MQERQREPVSPSSPKVAIHLFGQMEVILQGGMVAKLPSRRTMWLLAILALRLGRPVERHILSGMLWPESSDVAARHNLRQTLTGLRRVLGSSGDLIAPTSPRSLVLQRSPAVWVDVLEFDLAIKDGSREALERGVELYRGPVLEGCEEPFAAEERNPRESVYLEALERIAAQHGSVGDHRGATEYLRRAVAADPFRESASRALMSSLAESGEAAAAMEVYRGFRRRLRTELRVEPNVQTLQLYRSLRARASNQDDQRPSLSENRRTPLPLNPLRGRKGEIREVRSLVERCRFVTLTGVGGVGKTRLAIAIAEQMKDAFLDGVRFVDLTPLKNSATIPSAIAAALDVQEHPGRPLLDSLAQKLAELDLLIVLDNCEHLTEGVASVVEALVSTAPGLHVVATSRQSIGVVGEFVWRVPSLPTPDPRSGALESLEASAARREHLLQSDAVQLFLERSQLDSSRREALSLSDLEAIGSICRRLDGIPLAIELAASRMSVLTPTQIESRLEDRFSLLTRGTATPTRHSTLRAAIKWSWDLLSEEERTLLMRLSVFRGGCSLEAVEAMMSDPSLALDLASNLVDRSLLVSNPYANESRFSMLESIRQFAGEHLEETKERESALDRHRDFYLAWVEQGMGNFNGPVENLWFSQLEGEHDNLRAAAEWCSERNDTDKALRFMLGLARFWDTYGHLNEGRQRVEAVLGLVKDLPPTQLIAKVYLHAGWMATVQRDCNAARQHYERVLPFFRDAEDAHSIAKVLICLGTATWYGGDCVAAKLQFEEALEIFRGLESRVGVATALNNLGEVALQRGETASAREYLELSIATLHDLEDKHTEDVGLASCNLSLAAFREGRYEEARTHVEASLRQFRDGAVFVDIPNALNMFAIVCAHFEEWDKAARLLGASEGLAARHGIPLGNLPAKEREAVCAATRRTLGQTKFNSGFEIGRQMTISDSIAFAFGSASLR